MQIKNTDAGYILRVEAGEEIKEALKTLCEEHNIKGGTFVGIGAISSGKVGFFDTTTKKYSFMPISEPHEITNITGHITGENGKTLIHAHITLTDKNGNARGGHLKSGIANPTCEIAITNHNTPLKRSVDPESGLPLLDLR